MTFTITMIDSNGLKRGDYILYGDGKNNSKVIRVDSSTTITARYLYWYENVWMSVKTFFKNLISKYEWFIR